MLVAALVDLGAQILFVLALALALALAPSRRTASHG